MDKGLKTEHGLGSNLRCVAARLITGTTHVILEPVDFIARLAALVPRPRVNLTRFARIIPDTRPLRGPAKAVQIHS